MKTYQLKTTCYATGSVFLRSRDVTILQGGWTLLSVLKGTIQLISKTFLKKLLHLYGSVKGGDGRLFGACQEGIIISFVVSLCASVTENNCSKIISGKAYAHKWGSNSSSCWGLMRNINVQSSCIRHDINVGRVEERWISFLLLPKEYVKFQECAVLEKVCKFHYSLL